MKYQKMIYQYLKQNTFFPITGGFYRSNAIEQLKGQLKQIHTGGPLLVRFLGPGKNRTM